MKKEDSHAAEIFKLYFYHDLTGSNINFDRPRAERSRGNGLDQPKLFDSITSEIIFTYSQYKRFNTETFDPEMETPKPF